MNQLFERYLFRHRNGIFEIGEVIGLDMIREDFNDGTSNLYPSGLLIVKMIATDVQVKVPYLVPSAGKSLFVGSMPEIGSLAVMANMSGDPQAASYVVLGFLPPPLNKMVAARKEMSRMTPGEVLIQGSANGVDDFWRSARIKVDEYGRLLISSGDDDLQIVVGDMLSNEYTPQVTVIKDSLTGATVIYKMSYGDNDTTVTRDGTLIQRWARVLQQMAGDWLTVLKGRFIVTSGQQIRFAVQGEDANYINIDPATGISVKAISKFIVDAGGRMDISCSDAVALSAFLDMVLMAGGNMQLKVVRDLLMTAANIQMNAATGDIVLTISPSGTIKIGGEMASQSIIRAEAFLTALAQSGSLLDSLGMPVTKPFLADTTIYKTPNVKVP